MVCSSRKNPSTTFTSAGDFSRSQRKRPRSAAAGPSPHLQGRSSTHQGPECTLLKLSVKWAVTHVWCVYEPYMVVVRPLHSEVTPRVHTLRLQASLDHMHERQRLHSGRTHTYTRLYTCLDEVDAKPHLGSRRDSARGQPGPAPHLCKKTIKTWLLVDHLLGPSVHSLCSRRDPAEHCHKRWVTARQALTHTHSCLQHVMKWTPRVIAGDCSCFWQHHASHRAIPTSIATPEKCHPPEATTPTPFSETSLTETRALGFELFRS